MKGGRGMGSRATAGKRLGAVGGATAAATADGSQTAPMPRRRLSRCPRCLRRHAARRRRLGARRARSRRASRRARRPSCRRALDGGLASTASTALWTAARRRRRRRPPPALGGRRGSGRRPSPPPPPATDASPKAAVRLPAPPSRAGCRRRARRARAPAASQTRRFSSSRSSLSCFPVAASASTARGARSACRATPSDVAW